MKRLVPIMAACILLAGCRAAPEEPRAEIEDAIITLPAVPGRPGAAYFTIRSNRPARLTAIGSPQIGRIELHESMAAGGMSRMTPLANPDLSPEAPLIFRPGGRHGMLYDIAPSVRPGARIRLTFSFDALPPASVEAEVRAPGDAGH